MDGLSILGVALGVGVVVYALSLRTADTPLHRDDASEPPAARRSPIARLRSRTARPGVDELGFGDEAVAPAPPPAPESFVYVPVLASGGSGWRTRVGGIVGLLAMVTIGAVAIALGVYQVGVLLNRMVEGFFGP